MRSGRQTHRAVERLAVDLHSRRVALIDGVVPKLQRVRCLTNKRLRVVSGYEQKSPQRHEVAPDQPLALVVRGEAEPVGCH